MSFVRERDNYNLYDWYMHKGRVYRIKHGEPENMTMFSKTASDSHFTKSGLFEPDEIREHGEPISKDLAIKEIFRQWTPQKKK